MFALCRAIPGFCCGEVVEGGVAGKSVCLIFLHYG